MRTGTSSTHVSVDIRIVAMSLMREKVCIVLNERESAKSKAAAALEKHLNDLGITATRLKVAEGLEKALKERPPQFVIIDYLLGDYSTGLDVMAALQKLPDSKRPQFLFFTDEPSVQVAVEALQAGALTYVELDDPMAPAKLSAKIQAHLQPQTVVERSTPPTPSLDELVWNAPASIAFQHRCHECLKKQVPIILLHAAPGAGASIIARSLIKSRPQSLAPVSINLRSYQGDLLSALGLRTPIPRTARFGLNAHFIVEHLEEDSGLLRAHLDEQPAHFWNNFSNSSLVLCTSQSEAVRPWLDFAPCTVLKIPSLSERSEDIPALVQRFMAEAEQFAGKRLKPLSSELVNWLKSCDWPGEIRQLQSTVIDAALSASSTDEMRAHMVELRAVWSENATLRSLPLDAVHAAFIFDASGQDLRRAALRLGCSAQELSSILNRGGA